jgi:hypothetical protein
MVLRRALRALGCAQRGRHGPWPSWLLNAPQRGCQGPSWRWPWLEVSLARPYGRAGSFRPVAQRRPCKGAGKKAQLGMAPCPQLGVLTRQLCQPAPQEPAASKGPLAPATPASKTPGKKHEVRDYTSALPTYSRRPQLPTSSGPDRGRRKR